MRARDLVEDLPILSADTDAAEAVRLMAERGLAALVVRSDASRPYRILSAAQVLRAVVPAYCQDDPALARVVDEGTAQRLARSLAGRPVAQLLPTTRDDVDVPRVDDDATLLEMAAVLAASRSPVLVVVHGGEVVGLVSARHLLGVLVPEVGA